MDDLAPETLIDESGARSPAERGGESPADKRLRVVHGNEIGAGHGLDEAELARRDPLDGSSDEERRARRLYRSISDAWRSVIDSARLSALPHALQPDGAGHRIYC